MQSGKPDQHIEAAKRRLAHLAGLGAITQQTERRILDAATERLGVVQGDLDRLRPRAIADGAAGDDYQRLTLEAGQLHTVIANAQQALAPAGA